MLYTALLFVTLCPTVVFTHGSSWGHWGNSGQSPWEDCKTTTMVVRNNWMHDNIEVIAFSRLTKKHSARDCLNTCRINEECYSFNYNKVSKWCYIGTTEEANLHQSRNSKYVAGVRRCIEHVDNSPWTNEEFAGGS